MLVAFLVTTVLFFLTLVSMLIFFKGPQIARYVMCDLLEWHKDRTLSVGYEKRWNLVPVIGNFQKMERIVLRTRLLGCVRCYRERVVCDSARVAHDRANPERLFDDDGPIHAKEYRQ